MMFFHHYKGLEPYRMFKKAPSRMTFVRFCWSAYSSGPKPFIDATPQARIQTEDSSFVPVLELGGFSTRRQVRIVVGKPLLLFENP